MEIPPLCMAQACSSMSAARAPTGTVFQLRADIGARHVFNSGDNPVQDPIDYIGSIGLQYAWGGTVPRKVEDSDGDGVTDDLDRCPGTPAGTPVDTNGCPLDDDGDGVTNDIDKCPGTPAGAKVDATGCELDSDGDGVGDARDQCPNTPAGAKVDEKGCELDSDGDGIVDREDKCPGTPKGERVDSTGCPFNKELLLQGVKFETNSAELLPESIPVLDRAISTLKRYPELNVEVAGHTDSRGSDAYNLQLSGRRAETRSQVPASRWRQQHDDFARLRRAATHRQQQHRRWAAAESPRRIASAELRGI